MNKELSVNRAQELVEVKVTAEDITKYFCPLATQKEVFMALGIIKSLKLNPFTHEVHLIKYDQKNPLDIVVGYEVYLKRADRTGKLDGWQADINKDKNVAWVKIWRKDWKEPFYWEVSLSEFNKKQATWNQIPSFMAKKVAIAQGFRLAFPDELGGMPYTQEETTIYDTNNPQIESSAKPEVTIPEPIKEEKSPEEENAYKKMLENFEKAKKKLGEEKYYQVLGGFGLEHSNQIRNMKLADQILNAMKKAHDESEQS